MATTTLFEFIIVTTICKEETSQQNNTVEKSDVWRASFGEKNLQFLTLFFFKKACSKTAQPDVDGNYSGKMADELIGSF